MLYQDKELIATFIMAWALLVITILMVIIIILFFIIYHKLKKENWKSANANQR